MSSALGWDATEEGFSALPIEVLHKPTWSYDAAQQVVTLNLLRTGNTALMRGRVLPVLQALETGVTLAQLVRVYHEGAPERSLQSVGRAVRALVNGLVEQGNLRILLPPTPAVFADRFRVLRELGRGGVGIAWLCEDLEHPGAAPAVVKHAWNWSGPLAERDASLRSEGDVLQSLDHPGITRLIARFDIDGRHHLVRSFVEGTDLLRLRLREGPMPPETRVGLLRQVGDILTHLHGRGYLSLDVNPSNFLLGPDGRVRLADLGHARALSEPLKGGRYGADGYMAPDVAKGGAGFSPRADVYGLGALGWFLATGLPPPATPPGPPTAWPESVTAQEREFLQRCLARDAGDRPATPALALDLLAPADR
ncbi:MAG TPA: protein kinase [Candidatus Thermoplasmatota archaeon]|nr:protein kinase [Candidatus Thermoplasmatota archaeon]